MKISIQIAAALAFLPLLNSPLLAAPSNTSSAPKVQAQPKLPHVTKDNFVGLFWRTASSSKILFSIKGNLLGQKEEWSRAPGGYTGFSTPPFVPKAIEMTAGLSNNQLAALMGHLNNSRSGEIREHAPDNPGISITLILSDKNDVDQSVQFMAYADSMPRSNSALAAFLRDLVQMKSPFF